MNNTPIKSAPTPIAPVRLSVDGNFISMLRFGEDEGTPYAKMCVLAKLPRAQTAQLLFLDATVLEAQIKRLRIGRRQRVNLVYVSDKGKHTAEAITVDTRFPLRRRRQQTQGSSS